MLDKPILISLMNQYNDWYGASFAQALEQFDEHNLELSGDIRVDPVPWFNTPIKIVDARNQAVLFEGLPFECLGSDPQPEQVIELAWYAAALCDSDIPQPICDAVTADPEILDLLVQELLDREWNQIHDDFEDPSSLALSRLIEVTGPKLTTKQLETLLERYMSSVQPDDLVTSALKTVLAIHGEYATARLTNLLQHALEANLPVEGPIEYLMIFLSEAGKEQHTAESFAAMRTAFRRSVNKQVAAICLGDFGDPRGIAVLRSWLDNHPETDRATRLEIISAIKRLGGD